MKYLRVKNLCEVVQAVQRLPLCLRGCSLWSEVKPTSISVDEDLHVICNARDLVVADMLCTGWSSALNGVSKQTMIYKILLSHQGSELYRVEVVHDHYLSKVSHGSPSKRGQCERKTCSGAGNNPNTGQLQVHTSSAEEGRTSSLWAAFMSQLGMAQKFVSGFFIGTGGCVWKPVPEWRSWSSFNSPVQFRSREWLLFLFVALHRNESTCMARRTAWEDLRLRVSNPS